MNKVTLSVVAISKNEERDILGFLENLVGWVDEIIIVDDGSTDNTKELAISYSDKVKFYEHPMQDKTGFAGQRNFGIQQATKDWVLNMDIDERVPIELVEEILYKIKCPEEFKGFMYKRLNFFLHRPMKAGGWHTWNKPQLAKRGSHYFKNKVHEECIIKGEIGQLKNKIWHLNDEDYRERMGKSVQYTLLEAEKLINKNLKVKKTDLLFKPIFEFIKKYLFKKGYLDGTAGIISAIHSACAVFKIHALVWDAQNKIPREQIENKIKSKLSGKTTAYKSNKN